MSTVKTKNIVASNIVKKEQLREVQKQTLANLKDALIHSAGPYGSTTGIIRDGQFTEYTKDGHTILESIKYNRSIESSIQKELTELTRYIVVKVGDGTTSAVILSSLIFDELCALEVDKKMPPYKIIELFKDIVEVLKKNILTKRRNLTLDDVYDIAMICTNNNKEVSEILYRIYEKHGLDVFIDVGTSTNHQNIIKSYDGLTLEVGYSDPAYINTMAKTNNGSTVDAGSSIIRNASIYAFQDPIDTPEMTSFLQAIIYKNIFKPYNEYTNSGNSDFLKKVVPTVIMAPKISIDNSTFMTDIVQYMYSFGDNLDMKPPLLIITNIGEVNYEIYSDLWRLCGCKPIKKYIDPEIQKKDIEEGKAPTPETVCNFCGYADEVKSDAYKTTFINPKDMFVDGDPSKGHSQAYKAQLNFIEQQLKVAEEQDEDINEIYNLKRRLHSLKANMVDYLVGGVTVTDRDSTRALVEDAVKNIRSASQNGVGYGANYEGLRAVHNYLNKVTKSEEEILIAKVIYNAYKKISELLYGSAIADEEEVKKLVQKSLDEDCGPINLTNLEFDGKVLSTIDSDVTILDVLAKIITIMFTTNQMLVQTPNHNMYSIDEF